jgi:hypothetical protein
LRIKAHLLERLQRVIVVDSDTANDWLNQTDKHWRCSSSSSSYKGSNVWLCTCAPQTTDWLKLRNKDFEYDIQVIVRVTDACPCNYEPNASSNKRWCWYVIRVCVCAVVYVRSSFHCLRALLFQSFLWSDRRHLCSLRNAPIRSLPVHWFPVHLVSTRATKKFCWANDKRADL